MSCSRYFAILLLGVAPISWADEGQTATSYGEMGVLQEYAPDSLRSGHAAMAGVIGAMQPYFDEKKRLDRDVGLNYIIEYAPLYQTHLNGDSGSTAGDEANFIFQWKLVDHGDAKKGNMLVWYQSQNTWTNQNTSDLMQRMGVLSPLNGGVTGDENQSSQFLQHFAWEQHVGDRLRFMVGKMTTRVLLNLNRYAVSDREDFYSPMLVNNPVAPYTARIGLGAFAQYQQDDWYLSGMVRQAGGSVQWFAFDKLHGDELEYVGEVAWTPKNVFGLGAGTYRFTPSYTDAVGEGEGAQPSGWTVAFSADQDVGDSLGLLLRYAYANEDFRAFSQRLSLGAQVKRPLGYQHDRIGIAAWWGEPTTATLDDEYGLEAFWKIQLAPFVELSADVQLIADPALSDDSVAVTGGLRVRLLF